MKDAKIEQIYLADGREAEQRRISDNGEEKVLEIYVDPPKQEKILNKRIIEKSRLMICERVIESIEDGEVVDRRVESIESIKPMEKLISCEEVETEVDQTQKNNYVTQENLEEAILSVVTAITKLPNCAKQKRAVKAKIKESAIPPAGVSMQAVVGERLEQNQFNFKFKPLIDIGLSITILGLTVVLGYLMFVM